MDKQESKFCRRLPEADGSQVQLTGFQYLAQDVQQQQQEVNPQMVKNWTQVDLSASQLVDKLQVEHEPFQVVWRRLSFEVNESSYTQLIGDALRRAGHLWPLSALSSCRDKAAGLVGEGAASKQPTALSSVASSVDQLGSAAELTARRPSRQRRLIFENLNGFVNSGEISAILGPSGAGKTSLLSAICGRTDNYRGSVQLLGAGKRRMRLSIIPQKDYLMEGLTVRENLTYSSRILNTSAHFDHQANVSRVARMLNLVTCLESRASQISGGEYKRVSIGQELLKQPDILILDEPTSGLDSLNCKKLIQSLGQLIEASKCGAIKPIAIVMTIHQPDIEIFQMFHHVYCMARRGRVIFDGKPSDAMRTLQEQVGHLLADRFQPNSAAATNPANLLIEIASEELYGPEPVERLASFQRKQFESLQSNLLLAAVQNGVQQGAPAFKVFGPSSMLASFSRSSTASSSDSGKPAHLVRDKRLQAKIDHRGLFWHHTSLLARRAFISTMRDPLMTVSAAIYHLMIPLVMWTVYSQNIGSTTACPMVQRDMDILALASNGTLDRVTELQEDLMITLECSTMFFITTYSFSMCSLTMAALAFPLSMHVLLKEVRNGWYSLPTFVIAKTLANFPFEVLLPVVTLVMVYVMLSMPSSEMEWRLWTIALVMGLVAMISHTQGLIFGALCMNSVQSAVFMATALSLPQVLLSGFTARVHQMPPFLRKLSWLSLFRYSSDSINIIRFGYGTCPCDQTTNDYLLSREPNFSDIPTNMRPLFTYYLSNRQDDADSTTTTIASATETVVSNVTALATKGLASIPGLSRELSLSSEARAELVKKVESNEVDLFARMADLVARSFTYGNDVQGCKTVRSQLLITAGTPADEFLPMLFLGMVTLLVVTKLILFVIVKVKIGSRI